MPRTFPIHCSQRKCGAANSGAVATHEGLFICALSPLILRLFKHFTKEENGAWKVKWLSQGHMTGKMAKVK